MMILWCNMHGGFVAGLALTAIFAGVAAVRFVVLREHDDLRRMGANVVRSEQLLAVARR